MKRVRRGLRLKFGGEGQLSDKATSPAWDEQGSFQDSHSAVCKHVGIGYAIG
jgi:hypothetical protein